MKEIESIKQLNQEVMKGPKTVISVYLPTCYWSQQMLRFLHVKERTYPNVIYLKLNASKRDENPDIATLLDDILQLQNNRSYPVTFFFQDRTLWQTVKGGPDSSNMAAFDSFFRDYVQL